MSKKTRSLWDSRPDLRAWWDVEKNYPLEMKDVTPGSNKRVTFTDPDDPDYSVTMRVKDFNKRKHPRTLLASGLSYTGPTTQEKINAPGSNGHTDTGRRKHDPDGMLGVSNTVSPSAPRIEFETDGKEAVVEIVGTQTPIADENDLFASFLSQRGIDPEKYYIADTLRTSEWQQARKVLCDGKVDYETITLYAYKYRLRERSTYFPPEHFNELVEIAKRGAKDALKKSKQKEAKNPNNTVRTLQISDLQIGKLENGGIRQEDLINRWFASLEAFADTIGNDQPVHVIFAGDCLEGNQSQGGKNMGFRTPVDIHQQVRMFHRLMMETVVILAGKTPDLTISVVGGNHDETDRRLGSSAGSNWATETAIKVHDAMNTFSKKAYEHVRILVPEEDKSWMTIDVCGTVWTIAHGHQWSRGKADSWWKEKCFTGDNAVGSHILAHGHEHTFYYKVLAGRSIVCSPTMDGGSDWFSQTSSTWQAPAGVVYDACNGHITNLGFV